MVVLAHEIRPSVGSSWQKLLDVGGLTVAQYKRCIKLGFTTDDLTIHSFGSVSGHAGGMLYMVDRKGNIVYKEKRK